MAEDSGTNAAILSELQNLNSTLEKLNSGIEKLTAPKPDKPDDDDDDGEEEPVKLTGLGRVVQTLILSLGQLPSIFAQQSADAQKFAQAANMSYTEGLRTTTEAREAMRGFGRNDSGTSAAELFKGIFAPGSVDFDAIIRQDQIRANIEGFTSTIGGFREGTEANTTAFIQFTTDAKKALGTEQFRMTAEVVRAMGVAGINSTQRLNEFRQATGLRTLSDTMLGAVINKNVLAFQLFGDSFAKSAVRAEQLGISLQAVTSAARANVMNVEGMMDTVNQLNALGANIDFTELLRLQEFEGTQAPEKILEYLKSATPTGQFSISSFAGIFEGLGFKMEDVMKVGGGEAGKPTMETILADLQKSLSKRQEPIETREPPGFWQRLGTFWEVFKESSPWLSSVVGAISSLILAMGALKIALYASSLGGGGGGGTPGVGMMKRLGGGLLVTAGIATVAKGVDWGADAVAKGGTANAAKGAGIGLGVGAVGGAAAGVGAAMLSGAAIGSAFPVVGTLIGAAVGLGGALILGYRRKKQLEEQQRRDAEMAAAAAGATPTTALAATAPPGTVPETTGAPAANLQNQQIMVQSFTTAVNQFSESSNKLVTKTEELINTLKSMNMPELTQAIKNAQMQINIDGRVTTVPQYPQAGVTPRGGR